MMKTRGPSALLLVAVVALLGPGASATHLTNSERWTAAESPYILGSDLVVEDDTHLVIESGVEVRADPHVRIIVEGQLNVEGTPEDPVVFTLNQGRDGYWGGIRFVFIDGSHQSSVVGAIVEKAQIGVRVGSAIVDVRDSTFRGNLVGLEFDNPVNDATVQGSIFESNETAVTGRTRNVVTLYGNDFWDNPTTLLPMPQRHYDCGPDAGVWNINSNDILRGPSNSEFYSDDVRTPPGSGISDYEVLASGNWWGTGDETRVVGRLRPEVDCCPSPAQKDIIWRPIADAPQTPYEPSGEDPDPDPPSGSTHGDPGIVTSIDNPKHGSCRDANKFGSLRGSAGRALGGPAQVTIALRKRTSSGCRWWEHERRRLVEGSCDDTMWFRAKVDDSEYLWKWRYRFGARLPKGKYMAWSYGDAEPIDLGRNQVAFRLR